MQTLTYVRSTDSVLTHVTYLPLEDATLLRGPGLHDFNLSSLASLGAEVRAARREHGLVLPDGIAARPDGPAPPWW